MIRLYIIRLMLLIIVLMMPFGVLGLNQAVGATTVINSFEDPNELSAWQIRAGQNSSGAMGQLSVSPGYRQQGAALDFQLGCPANASECQLRAATALTPAVPGNYLDIWISCSACDPTYEVKDGTGQWLTYKAAPLPLSARALNAWHRVFISLPNQIVGHRGGANDGVFHQGVQEIRIIVPRDELLGSNGKLMFDEIRIHRNLSDVFPGEITINPAIDEFLPTGLSGFPLKDIMRGVSGDGLLAGESGFTSIRTPMIWANVERVVGKFDFSVHDRRVQRARLSGATVLFTLGFGHPLHTGGRPPRTAPEIAAFAAFAAAAAQHYRGEPVAFEIWNEPSFPNFWQPTPSAKEYGRLLAASIAAIRRVSPTVRIVTGGLPGWGNWEPWDFLREMIRSNAVAGADALGIHPYTENKVGEPEGRWQHILRGRRLVRQEMNERALPLALTEWGISSTPLDPGGNGHAAASRHAQAVRVIRSYLTWFNVGPVEHAYFNLMDACSDARVIDCNLGLYTTDIQKKPAMAALEVLASTISDRSFGGMLRQSEQLPPWLNVASFDGPTDVVLAAWMSVPKKITKLRLPAGGSATNVYGAPLTPKGGSVLLTYDGGPIYLRAPK